MHYETETQRLLVLAGRMARNMGHSYVGSVHLLLAFSQIPGIWGQMLRFAGFDFELAKTMAIVLYGVGTPGLPLPQGFTSQAKYILRGAKAEAQYCQHRSCLCCMTWMWIGCLAQLPVECMVLSGYHRKICRRRRI